MILLKERRAMRLRARIKNSDQDWSVDRSIPVLRKHRELRFLDLPDLQTPKGLPIAISVELGTGMGAVRITSAGTNLLDIGGVRADGFTIGLLLPTEEELELYVTPS